MNTTTFFRKRNVVLFVTSSILIVAVLVSVIGRPTNMRGTTIGNNRPEPACRWNRTSESTISNYTVDDTLLPED
jgi:hypothetical protein